MQSESLKGLKVLEVASVLAGPAAGMFFAELGARVIKVENRSKGGDMTRTWKLPSEDVNSPVSAYFSAVNYGKEYLNLDLNHAEDLDRLLRELGDTDILINNMKSSSAQRFGLDAESLRQNFPALIIAEVEGFASDASRVAFDAVLQAETGYISMCGSPLHPAKLPVAFIDIMAAHQLKEGILLALIHKSKYGGGAKVSVSLEETAMASLANQASNNLMTGHIPAPIGTLHPNIAPYGEIVSSSDGQEFILALGTNRQFMDFCSIIGMTDLDERFKNNASRVLHRLELLEYLQAMTSEQDGEALYTSCISKHIPIGKIRKVDEVMASEVAQKLILNETIESTKTSRLKTAVFHIQR